MENNKAIAAGFVYLSNSPISHLEWLISSPDSKNREGIVYLVKRLIKEAEDGGCPIVFTSYDNNEPNSDSLQAIYKSTGFTKVSSSMAWMIKAENVDCFLCDVIDV